MTNSRRKRGTAAIGQTHARDAEHYRPCIDCLAVVGKIRAMHEPLINVSAMAVIASHAQRHF